ncbi:MAG TPA: hypothetical protein VIL37_15870 [Natronosporangium sp.]
MADGTEAAARAGFRSPAGVNAVGGSSIGTRGGGAGCDTDCGGTGKAAGRGTGSTDGGSAEAEWNPPGLTGSGAAWLCGAAAEPLGGDGSAAGPAGVAGGSAGRAGAGEEGDKAEKTDEAEECGEAEECDEAEESGEADGAGQSPERFSVGGGDWLLGGGQKPSLGPGRDPSPDPDPGRGESASLRTVALPRTRSGAGGTMSRCDEESLFSSGG